MVILVGLTIGLPPTNSCIQSLFIFPVLFPLRAIYCLESSSSGEKERGSETCGVGDSAEAAFMGDYREVLAAEAPHHFLSSAQR